MNIFTGQFINLEAAGQKVFTLNIYDRENQPSENEFNLLFWVRNLGDGTQDVLFTWDSLAAINPTNGIYVGYYDGTYHNTAVDRRDTFAKINIPEGDYTYFLYIDYTSGTDIRYEPTAGSETALEMADIPVSLEVVDNDEDAFTPIRSKRLNIQIHSSDEIGIETFVDGGDNRFYVELLSEEEGIIFCGYLSTEDITEDFLPDPNIISLIATDGLGFLSDEPLVNFDGETPEYEHPMMSFLCWALAKTGLNLNLNVVMNVREESASPMTDDATGMNHFYKYIYLNAKTFEEEIGTCINCRDVLEQILGEGCELFQWKGDWVIRRVDEVEPSTSFYFWKYDYKGQFINSPPVTLEKEVGVDLPMAWMNDDATVGSERSHQKVIETYKYETWKELVCNQDFTRGDFVSDQPDITIEGEVFQVKRYEVDCWSGQKFPANAPGDPNGGQIIPADNKSFIERRSQFGYEKERYIVLTPGTGYDFEGISSQPINVLQGEKINVSVAWRLPSDVGAGMGSLSLNIFSVWIVTTTGSWYYLSQFYQSGAQVPNGKCTWQGPYDGQRAQAIQYTFIPDQTNETEWVTISADAPALPASGKLYIGLWKVWQGSSLWNVDTHFSSLQIEFLPFVNGSYQLLSGQQHIVNNSSRSSKAVREKDVYVSDSPSLNYKGALLKVTGSQQVYSGDIIFGTDAVDGTPIVTIHAASILGYYIGQRITIAAGINSGIYTITNIRSGVLIGPVVFLNLAETVTIGSTTGTISIPTIGLSGRFYAGNVFPSGPPDPTYYKPFGEMQSFDVFNQYNRSMRIFEGTIDGTESGSSLPDLTQRYVLTDQNRNSFISDTIYRVFRLLHFSMDYHLCQWQAFFRETVKTDEAKQYTGHEFKYLQDNE